MQALGTAYVFDLDIRDYNLWLQEEFPVVLILFDASRKKAYWLAIQRYFLDGQAKQPRRGNKTVRVHVPKRQVVNRRAIQELRELKRSKQRPVLGVHP